ncbi:glycoside hydrolase family 10 protein [Streptomyces bohaiensis]|uniref:Family 10 glycosylhydrolase n=1 Tax=Streptomyces bohaiensis TaxID=1431344 RepID=A0ABX1CDR9_9ACTN|nr:family 10 glycosylhydrolase [Streptomyces bohaiensis]NJQ16451.1 family 10 glycosylhydrolase [Streptomyces bohaiensis]
MGHLTRRTFTAVAAGAAIGSLALTRAGAATPPGGGDPEPDTTPGERAAWRPEGELRGVWIASVNNGDWPSKPGQSAEQVRSELRALFDDAARWNLNTVFLQVRPTADAFWPSPHEPWSSWLTGVQGADPGWDPLAFAVEEAHARGLALHAWFNPYRIANHDDPARLAADHPARRNPGWVVRYGGGLYYNPGIPEVRRFTQEAMIHAAENYAIDGVHWDDYFYPYPVAGEEFDDAEAFAEYGGDFDDLGEWRRNNVNLLVREMHERVKAVRADLAFGISPFGVWRNRGTDPAGSDTRSLQAYDELFADTRGWVRNGWMDYVVPQLYWHIGLAAADYAKLVPWWSEVCAGTGVRLIVGEAMYKVGDAAQPDAWQDPAELSRHLTLAAEAPEVTGHVFFAASQVKADPLGAMSRVYEDHYR